MCLLCLLTACERSRKAELSCDYSIVNLRSDVAISEWAPADADATLEMLADVLHAAVHAGASVSFVLPFSLDEARAFWRDQVAPRVAAGTRRVLIASTGDRIVGTQAAGSGAGVSG